MFNVRRFLGVPAVLALVLLTAAALAPRGASADGDLASAALPGVTIGGRASYDRPKGADNGALDGGAQLRIHFLSILAVEGSADFRQNKYGGTTVNTTPVQASLMLYLTPSWVVSPYILGGVGWYHTHIVGGGSTERYGPHAGAGLEVALSRHWTIDGSYRYLWTQSLTAPTNTSPVGKNFSDNGYMLTAAINFRF